MKYTGYMNSNINTLNQLIRVDMHIHVNRFMNKELLKKVFTNAEKNDVKVLSFVMHDDLFPYFNNSPLMEMIKSGEINNYYSGKIVTGIELDCLIDGAKNYSSNGYDFNGDIVHILMYDYDMNKLIAPGMFFNEETREKNFYEDMEFLKAKLKEYGFVFPADFSFVYGIPYPDQLWNLLTDPNNADLKLNFQTKLNIPDSIFESKSNFARSLTNFKEGIISQILHKNQKTLIKIKEAIKLANESGGKLVLAHPARMNGVYVVKDYMETILKNFGDSFYGIEMIYGLDDFKTTKEIFKAFYELNENGEFGHLKMTGGSEYLTYLEKFKFGGLDLDQFPGQKVASNFDGSDKFIAVPSLDVEEYKNIIPQKLSTKCGYSM